MEGEFYEITLLVHILILWKKASKISLERSDRVIDTPPIFLSEAGVSGILVLSASAYLPLLTITTDSSYSDGC